ncbi:MAG: hypothetical protein ABWY28_22820 [Pseudomonas prosekii]
MIGKTARQCSSWRLPCLIVISLALTAGCSSRSSSTQGSSCYAKAVPTAGEGGLAWGDSLHMARKKSLDNCYRYASRSGGTPKTCQVVLAKCKN